MLPSLLDSPDPVLRAAAEERRRLHERMLTLETLLRAYAEQPAFGSFRCDAPQVAPLDHAPMRDDDACGCTVCVEWRLRREEMQAAMRFVPEGHRWSICACAPCRFAGRMHLNYVAAANVRDLSIEVAYHATWHSAHGEKVMDWLANDLRSPRYTTQWCAYEIGRRSIDEWLDRCEKDLRPILSGAVFMMGAGRRYAAEANISSPLGAAMASTMAAIG